MAHTAAEMGVSRYFFSSSVCIYRDMQPDEPPLTEDDATPAEPDNEYGRIVGGEGFAQGGDRADVSLDRGAGRGGATVTGRQGDKAEGDFLSQEAGAGFEQATADVLMSKRTSAIF